MQINRVSFGNQELNDLIAQPPATSVGAMAAAGMYESEPDSFQRSSTGKKIATTVAVVGLAAGALALLRGKVLKDVNIDAGMKAQEGVTAKAKYVVAKAGQSVIDGAKAVKALFSKKAKLDLAEGKLTKAQSEKSAAEKALAEAKEALSKAADDAKETAQAKVTEAQNKLNGINEKISNLEKNVTDIKATLNKADGGEAAKATEETTK